MSFLGTGFASGTGAAVSQPRSTFVFREGGVASQNVYTTWSSLMGALSGVSGRKTILYDDSIVSPLTIPAGGPYDVTDVVHEGIDRAAYSDVEIADGASFVGLRHITKNLRITNLNTTTPADTSLAADDVVIIDFDCNVSTVDAGAPLWQLSGLSPGQFVAIFMNRFSSLGRSGNAGSVFSATVAGSGMVIRAGVGSLLPPNTRPDVIKGAAGTVLIPAVLTMGQAPNGFPGWSGTALSTALDGAASLQPNPAGGAIATSAVTAAFKQWIRLDVSGGAVAQGLPSISGAQGASPNPGGVILVTEHGNSAGLTLTPGSGDTINGGAGAFTIPANGGAWCVSDGVSDWKVF